MSKLDRCFNIEDLRSLARHRLPSGIFEYIDGGTEDGVALRGNRSAFERLHLNPRFLVGLNERDMGTEIFGERIEHGLGGTQG